MVFHGYKDTIDEGDLVILQVTHDDLKAITVKDGVVTQTAAGAVRHTGLIGYPYGKRFLGTMGDVIPLFPTPELWTLTLPHRTQIIYSHDISMIVQELELVPGKIVLESGTGSGSLTHALARAVSPNGQVHTCEFHADRARAGRSEFVTHGMSDVATVYFRDVCHPKNSTLDQCTENIEEGFPAGLNANAVILDVPKPWLALESAMTTMDQTQNCRICTFSPCIEQVQNTVVFAYQKWGDRVREMSTIEFGVKDHNVKTKTAPFADLGLTVEQNREIVKLREGEFCNATPSGALSTTEVTVAVPPNQKRSRSNVMSDGSREEVTEIKKLETELKYNTLVTAQKCYGHTGYLTFFSIVPERVLPTPKGDNV